MRPRSLRARVVVLGVVTLAVVLSVGGWLTARALSAGLRSDLNAQNAEVLERLADQIEQGDDPRTLRIPVGADGTDFLILDADGVPMNASFLPISGLEINRGVPIPTEVIPDGGITGQPGASADDTDEFFFATEQDMMDFFEEGGIVDESVEQIPTDEVNQAFIEAVERAQVAELTSDWFDTRRTIVAPSGDELTLIALSPFGVLNRSIDRLATALIIIVPLVVALGGIALWLAIGSALEPVSRLSAEARRIAPSTSGARLDVPASGDEIADLTVTLNEMLDRLDNGLTRQRQFVSDASHELRSPLTAVKGVGEVMASDQRLPDDLRASAEALGRGVIRLETVLDDLTDLAGAGTTTARTEIDLADLVLDEVRAVRALNGTTGAVMRPGGEGDGPAIDVSRVTPAAVAAYPVRLGRAVRNLLDNALRHAERRVAVSCEVTDGVVTIVVDDDGSGIPAGDRDRVFDRFVRLDDGRDRQQGGSGLGLAIVATIAQDHNGTVCCETSPMGGARFVLSFPA